MAKNLKTLGAVLLVIVAFSPISYIKTLPFGMFLALLYAGALLGLFIWILKILSDRGQL